MSTFEPLPGRLGNLTSEQQTILDQFRKELTNEGWIVPERHDDAMLLRFLRARKFDLVKAKEMFIAAEKWRKEFNVDDIVKSVRHHSKELTTPTLTETLIRNFKFPEKEEVNKYYPQYYHKTDKVCFFLPLVGSTYHLPAGFLLSECFLSLLLQPILSPPELSDSNAVVMLKASLCP
jgi:hypothetical protein